MLPILVQVETLLEREQLAEEARELLATRIDQLERSEVDPRRLMMRRTLSKNIEDYTVETRTAIAAGKLRDKGVRVHPGERVNYLIADARATDKSKRVEIEGVSYDVAVYTELLRKAGSEVCG